MRSSNRVRLGSPGLRRGDARPSAVIVDAHVEPPVVVRAAGGRILFGAAAAGPLGGDTIDLEVVVDEAVVAAVGTVGATMALPGAVAGPSRSTTSISVGAGSHLLWAPEPTISVVGSVHHASVRVRLAPDATCRIVEEFTLGRTGEPSGTLVSSLRVERAGAVVVHHDEAFGPHQIGAGSVAAGPHAGHVVVAVEIGPASPGDSSTTVCADAMAGRLVLAEDATMIIAVAADRPTALAIAAEQGLTTPVRGSTMVRPSDQTAGTVGTRSEVPC